MNLSLERAQVIGIEELGEYDVYDIEVKNHHNFFVEGINVHNSSDPRRLLGS